MNAKVHLANIVELAKITLAISLVTASGAQMALSVKRVGHVGELVVRNIVGYKTKETEQYCNCAT